MTHFAGWEMPVQYAGVIAEHRAVRSAAGLFDLSHMGEIEVRGGDALAYLNHTLTNDASVLGVGQAQYTLIPYTDGTVVDDAILYRLRDRWLLVVNASNRAKDLDWLRHEALGFADVRLRDVSDDTALIALQGPRAAEILAPLTTVDVSSLPGFHAAEGAVSGVPALMARTGYTGEDGFELFVAPEDAPRLWDALLDAGRPLGLVPAGLGAPDTLRLEARMALYGHELSEDTNPLEAGLGWAVKLEKGDFVGREALAREKKLGPARRLVGFELLGPGVPRAQQPVLHRGEHVGMVTSGTHSPTLNKPVGLAYVPVRLGGPGSEFEVLVRDRPVRARVVPTPFYKRRKGEDA
jgi:aminomethyltransferase